MIHQLWCLSCHSAGIKGVCHRDTSACIKGVCHRDTSACIKDVCHVNCAGIKGVCHVTALALKVSVTMTKYNHTELWSQDNCSYCLHIIRAASNELGSNRQSSLLQDNKRRIAVIYLMTSGLQLIRMDISWTYLNKESGLKNRIFHIRMH